MARARTRDAFAVAMVGAALLATSRPSYAEGDDLAVALTLTAQLQRDVAARPPLAPVVAVATAKAAEALERARRMRAVGDEAHAREADGLAREWAETGRDLVRAVDAETRAADLRRSAVESQAQLERTRALVEEGIAHVGRWGGYIDKEQKAAPPPRTAVETHDGEARPPSRKAGAKPAKGEQPAKGEPASTPPSDGTP